MAALEDDTGAEVSDVVLDERADLPAHEVGEGEEEAEGDGGVGLAGEGDAEDEGEDGDEAGQGAPGRRGVDADGCDEEAEGGDAEDFGEERGGAFAGDVDDGAVGSGVGVEGVHGGLRTGAGGATVGTGAGLLALRQRVVLLEYSFPQMAGAWWWARREHPVSVAGTPRPGSRYTLYFGPVRSERRDLAKWSGQIIV